MTYRFTRRGFIATAGASATVALAGCTGDPPGANLDDLDADTRPTRGQLEAPVPVTVFEDFGCPACRDFKNSVSPQLVQNHVETGEILLYHADFPIPVDSRWSRPVANGARAVYEEAGDDAFWDFASDIYEHQGNYSYDVIEDVANDVAEVGPAARDAADNRSYTDVLDDDVSMAEDWGVDGTPSVFVGEESVDSGYQEIQAEITDQL